MTDAITTTIKHTVSMKQRNEVGDEVFISVGQEYSGVPLDQEDDMKQKLSDAVAAMLEDRVKAIAGAAFESYSDPDEGEVDDEDEAEDEADEEEEGDDEEDGDELTYEDVAAMKIGELRELIKEHELDVDPKLKVKELREAVLAELFAEDEDDEDEDEEEADEEDEADNEEESEDEDDEDEEEDEEEDDEEPYTEDELKALKLTELQEIAEVWELEVKLKKGADLKAKKAAYIKAIMSAQEDAE